MHPQRNNPGPPATQRRQRTRPVAVHVNSAIVFDPARLDVTDAASSFSFSRGHAAVCGQLAADLREG